MLTKIFNIFESILILEEYEEAESNENNNANIIDRLDRLEHKILNEKKLKCFLSYRFSDYSKSLIFEITRFLELVNIEVISGISYEPRKISQKVKDKLDKEFDFFIYLITDEDGESMWIRDELAISYQNDRAIIPLIEEGAKFEAGILGDWEYIPFKRGDISKTYIGILEAIKFLKSINLDGIR